MATWTAAGKRRMSAVCKRARAPRPLLAGRMRGSHGVWRMLRVGIETTARRDADMLSGAGGGAEARGWEHVA